MGGGNVVDSLVFGGKKAAVLSVGQESGWLDLPNGVVKLRVVDVQEPPKPDLDRDLARLRMEETERNLIEYFAGLQQRWPVKILDARLRGISLPGPGPRR